MERKGNLIKLTDLSSDFIIDLKYATPDNFTGVQVYQSADCWLDEHTAQILIKAKEIFEKDGKICQRPIRELEEKKHLVSDVKGMLAGDGYPVYEMTISDITKNRFKVILSEKLILDYADGKFQMRFTDQDKTSVSSGRSMRYVEVEEVENLKILADTSSVEVFINDGEYVFSTRYYPEVYKLQAEAVGAQITLSEIM